jgi:DNA-binding response OmpR family regulator
MRALIADDDRVTAAVVSRTLERWRFEVTTVHDGESAWARICEQAPSLALVDWMMPGLNGLDLCQRIRQDVSHQHMYVILLTSRDGRGDLVAGLDAGADDYVVKPFDVEELRARVQTGVRVVTLQEALTQRVTELQAALATVRQLEGLLPICSYCKRIRAPDENWVQLEAYISRHSAAEFSHGICPECMKTALEGLEGLEG